MDDKNMTLISPLFLGVPAVNKAEEDINTALEYLEKFPDIEPYVMLEIDEGKERHRFHKIEVKRDEKAMMDLLRREALEDDIRSLTLLFDGFSSYVTRSEFRNNSPEDLPGRRGALICRVYTPGETFQKVVYRDNGEVESWKEVGLDNKGSLANPFLLLKSGA